MTALENVWLTAENGSILRADHLCGLELRGVSARDGDRAVDAELWALTNAVEHGLLLAVSAARWGPALLAGLVDALTNTCGSSEPVLHIAVARQHSEGNELEPTWTVEPRPPFERWRVTYFGE